VERAVDIWEKREIAWRNKKFKNNKKDKFIDFNSIYSNINCNLYVRVKNN
jgi:hypothetical protein